MKKILYTIAYASLLPAIVFAQRLDSVSNADNLMTKITDLANSAVWLLISLAVLFIIWNGVQFIRTAGGDDRKKYQAAVMYGILGLFIILSLWGLVNILQNTFNVEENTNVTHDINALIPRGDCLSADRSYTVPCN